MSEERVKRKLSAILSADVVGYSRLMGEDEVSTVRTLEAYRKVMSDLIEQFRGRVVDSPGDNLLAEFGSVVDAVQCAVEIHEVIRAKNEELSEDRQMLFRIGVNLGDVIEEGDRIYGDGVNIAARLEGLAEAGGICISGTAHEHIKNKLALGYEYIGEHTVKNIADPLKVYRVPVGPKAVSSKEGDERGATLRKWRWTAIGAVGVIIIIGALAIWNLYFRGPSIESDKAPVVSDLKEAPKTIAVLPFDDISPDKDQGYFADGLTEDISSTIGRISGLTVKARTSSFYFKGSNKKITEIANELGVDHIIEGSVSKFGNDIRIIIHLVRALDGSYLWSETYDREFKKIFAIREDIANSVADRLKLTLEAFKLLGGTENVEAYEFFLVAKGQYYEYELSRALDSINAAIELDPEFALAWVWKSKVLIEVAANSSADRFFVARDRAEEAVLKAKELEPGLGQAYIWLAAIHRIKSNFIDAELAFRKGMELTTDPIDYYEYSVSWSYGVLGYLRKLYEFLEEIRENDPRQPQSHAEYMLISAYLGHNERAEKEYEHGRAIFGDQWDWGHGFITFARLGVKDDLSINEIPELPRFDPIWSIAREHIEAKQEGLSELHRIYSSNENLSAMDLQNIPIFAAYFGDPEFALNVIERGNAFRTSPLYFIWSPVMKEVRQLPRFKEFVREIGLVDYWKEYGWPDLCRPVGEDDFVCD